MSDSLCSIWAHSVHFANFPMFRLSKGYCCHSFHSISTKLYHNMLVMGATEAILFFSVDLPTVKNVYSPLDFVNT